MGTDENAQAQAQEAELVIDESVTEGESPTDKVDTINDVEELRKLAKGYRAAAQRYKGKASEKVEPTQKPEPKETPQPKVEKTTLQEPAPFDSIVKVFSTVKDLATDEIAALESDARDLGVEPLKYIQSNAGKARLEKMRAEQKSKEAAPEVGTKSPVFKKYGEDDLRKMTAAELEKIIPR
jgi:hypothetical protein